MPVKIEKEDIINWLNNIINPNWNENFWINKYTNLHIIRYRFGDKNVVQIYLKNKTWKEIPLPLWLIFTEMNTKILNENCWNWIKQERLNLGVVSAKTTHVKNNDVLDF